MSEEKTSKQHGAVQTTGHAWDGDIQEFNNPLPRWWLWSFYATVVFSIIYWVIFPAWPVGKTYTTGVMNDITYKVNGKEVTTHWNTRALLMRDMQQGEDAVKQRKYMKRVAGLSFSQVLGNAEMMDFTRKVGKVLFADNCAACHGSGGQGKIGLFPNLVDDDWLWGGAVKEIQATITHGRQGFMPSFKPTFTKKQLNDVVDYVLSLSGHKVDVARANRGKALFNGQAGGCYYCHTKKGTGMKSAGSANLTDSVWTVANVNGQKDLDGKRAEIRKVIMNGISRKMPAWKDRLSATEIKLLTLYVYDLGGGKK